MSGPQPPRLPDGTIAWLTPEHNRFLEESFGWTAGSVLVHYQNDEELRRLAEHAIAPLMLQNRGEPERTSTEPMTARSGFTQPAWFSPEHNAWLERRFNLVQGDAITLYQRNDAFTRRATDVIADAVAAAHPDQRADGAPPAYSPRRPRQEERSASPSRRGRRAGYREREELDPEDDQAPNVINMRFSNGVIMVVRREGESRPEYLARIRRLRRDGALHEGQQADGVDAPGRRLVYIDQRMLQVVRRTGESREEYNARRARIAVDGLFDEFESERGDEDSEFGDGLDESDEDEDEMESDEDEDEDETVSEGSWDEDDEEEEEEDEADSLDPLDDARELPEDDNLIRGMGLPVAGVMLLITRREGETQHDYAERVRRIHANATLRAPRMPNGGGFRIRVDGVWMPFVRRVGESINDVIARGRHFAEDTGRRLPTREREARVRAAMLATQRRANANARNAPGRSPSSPGIGSGGSPVQRPATAGIENSQRRSAQATAHPPLADRPPLGIPIPERALRPSFYGRRDAPLPPNLVRAFSRAVDRADHREARRIIALAANLSRTRGEFVDLLTQNRRDYESRLNDGDRDALDGFLIAIWGGDQDGRATIAGAIGTAIDRGFIEEELGSQQATATAVAPEIAPVNAMPVRPNQSPRRRTPPRRVHPWSPAPRYSPSRRLERSASAERERRAAFARVPRRRPVPQRVEPRRSPPRHSPPRRRPRERSASSEREREAAIARARSVREGPIPQGLLDRYAREAPATGANAAPRRAIIAAARASRSFGEFENWLQAAVNRGALNYFDTGYMRGLLREATGEDAPILGPEPMDVDREETGRDRQAGSASTTPGRRPLVYRPARDHVHGGPGTRSTPVEMSLERRNAPVTPDNVAAFDRIALRPGRRAIARQTIARIARSYTTQGRLLDAVQREMTSLVMDGEDDDDDFQLLAEFVAVVRERGLPSGIVLLEDERVRTGEWVES